MDPDHEFIANGSSQLQIARQSSTKQPKKSTSNFRQIMKKQLKDNLLLIATVLAVGLGIGIAFILRGATNFKPPEKAYFGFPGELFLRMLKFLILPLISSSLITGIAGLGTQRAGKIAGRALVYYFATTVLAVVLGLVLVATIKPGSRTDAQTPGSNENSIKDPLNDRIVKTEDTILDLIRNLFPDNIVTMTFQQYSTQLKPVYKKPQNTSTTLGQMTTSLLNTMTTSSFNDTNSSEAITSVKPEIDYYAKTGVYGGGINVLGLVMFCFVFGAVIGKMGEAGEILVKFFEALNEASISMINLVMYFSPIGICSLICVAVLEMEDPAEIFKRISYYMLTVLVGLSIHGLVVLPLIYVIFTRRNVFKFMFNMLEALLIALATSSSSATLPITFRCIEDKNKIHKIISRFVLPVGATVNMDGTALYEAVAAIFIAQVNNRPLPFVDLLVTSVTATLASIGAAGVPSAGLITMVIVLSALGLPQDQISLIYAVDWLLDRFRTMINVWGDSIGAGVVAALSKKEIEEYEKENKTIGTNEMLMEYFKPVQDEESEGTTAF